MQYKHFTIEERETIQEMLWQRKSIRAIAKRLNRSPSSISREVNKNRDSINRRQYTPRIAHEKALINRSRRGREKRLKSEKVRYYVIKHLKLGWSPEQISGTIEDNINETISFETIYQYVYAQIHRNGHGYTKPGCEDLRPYLARRRKRRNQQSGRKSHRIDKGPLPSIEDRPQEVGLRIDVGHWENDLIVSNQSKYKLKTINERYSGLVFIKKIKNGTIEESNKAMIERLSEIPRQYLKTLTMDRGSENLGYQEIENTLGFDCFYAHSYCSWERGSNENLNGLIRRFLPKKTDFRIVTNNDIKKIEYLLNSRPRKRLGWKTPYEVFYEMTGVALQS
ncbi:MAG: IS30 family transposase [Patescibacteria group bacterium]|jgi:IS30 family transposase|nr:IS30 family transposase [Patescibacteria group bacterium]